MERRLAAILAADVVGYTRLMGDDEAGTLERLTAVREQTLKPIITRHHGRIVKLMGDGLLVEFASVVDAVTCALVWQEAVTEREAEGDKDTRLQFRIGLNLGDVIVEGDDIHGDGVNIAARIEAQAEPGGICLSGDAYRQTKGKVEAEFEDLGERELKNVAEPVRVYRVTSDCDTPVSSASGLAILPSPDRPSIAVLPFDNMSGDPDQEYFSDGISEDIITDLSKISGLFVIARNSSFTYKGEAVNIQQVSRDLGVRYMVEGSVRKAGNRARITAQLIDAHTGGHVWADRYDRELVDIFAVQDEITSEIVGALHLVLLPGEAEAVAQAPTSDFQAYDFYLKGRQIFHSHVRSKFIEARHWFERAIKCDPNFARAYCGIADCGLLIYSQYDGDRSDLEGAMEAITRALELEPNLADAHASMGLALSQIGESSKAEEEFQKAAALDPDLYQTHYYWARFYWEQGEFSLAASHFEQAWRISPRDPQAPFLLMAVYDKLGREEDVKNAAQKTLETAMRKLEVEPNDSRSCFQCGHALARMDRYSEAEDMIVRSIELDPSDKIVVYNAACMYATMGKPDQALDTLEKMPGVHTQMLDWIKNDGDLDSLRDNPRFKIFMERLEDSTEIPEH